MFVKFPSFERDGATLNSHIFTANVWSSSGNILCSDGQFVSGAGEMELNPGFISPESAEKENEKLI